MSPWLVEPVPEHICLWAISIQFSFSLALGFAIILNEKHEILNSTETKTRWTKQYHQPSPHNHIRRCIGKKVKEYLRSLLVNRVLRNESVMLFSVWIAQIRYTQTLKKWKEKNRCLLYCWKKIYNHLLLIFAFVVFFCNEN